MVVSGAGTCTPRTCLKSRWKLRDLLTEDSHYRHELQYYHDGGGHLPELILAINPGLSRFAALWTS